MKIAAVEVKAESEAATKSILRLAETKQEERMNDDE